jgi:hypothetical protein
LVGVPVDRHRERDDGVDVRGAAKTGAEVVEPDDEMGTVYTQPDSSPDV